MSRSFAACGSSPRRCPRCLRPCRSFASRAPRWRVRREEQRRPRERPEPDGGEADGRPGREVFRREPHVEAELERHRVRADRDVFVDDRRPLARADRARREAEWQRRRTPRVGERELRGVARGEPIRGWGAFDVEVVAEVDGFERRGRAPIGAVRIGRSASGRPFRGGAASGMDASCPIRTIPSDERMGASGSTVVPPSAPKGAAMNFEALQAAGATTAPASARDTATRPRVARIGREDTVRPRAVTTTLFGRGPLNASSGAGVVSALTRARGSGWFVGPASWSPSCLRSAGDRRFFRNGAWNARSRSESRWAPRLGSALAMGGCGGTVSGSPTPAGDAGSSPFNPPPRADSGAPVMPGVDALAPRRRRA